MAFVFPPDFTINRTGENTGTTLLADLGKLRDAVLGVQYALSFYAGGGTGEGKGVVPFGSSTLLMSVVPNDPPGMRVAILQGLGFCDHCVFGSNTDTLTAAMVAPVANPRIDLVVADVSAGVWTPTFVVIEGTEAAFPVSPEAGDNQVALAQIHHKVGEFSILETDSSTEGYIEDVRQMMWIPPVESGA